MRILAFAASFRAVSPQLLPLAARESADIDLALVREPELTLDVAAHRFDRGARRLQARA